MKKEQFNISLGILIVIVVSSFMAGGVTGNFVWNVNDEPLEPMEPFESTDGVITIEEGIKSSILISKINLLSNNLIQHANFIGGIASNAPETIIDPETGVESIYDDDPTFWAEQDEFLMKDLEELEDLLNKAIAEGDLTTEEAQKIYNNAKLHVDSARSAIATRGSRSA